MDGLLGPYFGNPNIQRQAAKARALSKQRDVNLLPDPKTYAVVQGLLGTAPDELGFSVLHPQYQAIRQVADPAFAVGTLLGVAPAPTKAIEKGAMAAGRAGERLAERVVPQIMERGGMPAGLLEGMSSRTISPLTVYHGSPAKFERFDPTKIGSGEGAQAYGYGHYVAQNPAVAKEYRTALSEPELFVKGRQIKTAAGSNMDTAKAWLQDSFEMGAKNPYADAIEKVSNAPLKDKQGVIDALRKLENRGVQMQKGGFEYEIDLPDEQIAKMLDWDKPLSKQKDVMAALNNVAENNVKAKVRNEIENQIRASGVLPADQTGDDYMSLLFGQSEETIAKANQMLKQLADEQMAKIDFAPLVKSELEGMKPPTMTWDATGKEFYEMLAQRRGSPEAASTLFREQGIPGIRYLDQGSRPTSGGQLLDVFETPNGWKSKVKVTNRGGTQFQSPSDIITTSMPFKTKEEATNWANEKIGSGTSNFVVFPGNEGLLTIQKRNNEVITPTSLLQDNQKFNVTTQDASEIFGEGAKRIRYQEPNSQGFIDVLQRPDGTASVLGLEVPEQMRGKGIGQSLQSKVMQDFPEMMGQVSSRAAAKTAYRLGRRPPNQPNATLEDVYKIMDEYSSVNLVSPEMQKRMRQSLLD